MQLPKNVQYIIDTLDTHGYEAYAVGGCVRDCLLGRTPNDWDICTSALPHDIIPLFEKVIPTGIKHGTVTVIINSIPYEVTTYRIDGEYTDNRRPDSVVFTNSITADLARRDFTVNAMAYNHKCGLCDPFGGREDLKNKVIRCVGDANKRFAEDALRILRAWRFSCQLGFEIESKTYESAKKSISLLEFVSAERVRDEFLKAITHPKRFSQLSLRDDAFLCAVTPEWSSMNIPQNNPHHIYSVAQHTLTALSSLDTSDTVVCLAVLLHDIAKPLCYSEDENGVGHFYKHAHLGFELADDILRRLKLDNSTRNAVTELIRYHDSQIPCQPKSIKKWLNKLGEVQLLRLLHVMRADVMGQNPELIPDRCEHIEQLLTLVNTVIAEGECFCVKDLAVNGKDLIEIGFMPNKRLGEVLDAMLDAVISDEIKNDKTTLLLFAKKLKYNIDGTFKI